MYGDVVYLDTSALVKLITPEPETIPLFRYVLSWRYRMSSSIAFVEVYRAVLRAAEDEDLVLRRTEQVLSGITFVDAHSGIYGTAALLQPKTLRSLDAIHIASAMEVRPGLGALITYDKGMAAAAKAHDFKVVAPS